MDKIDIVKRLLRSHNYQQIDNVYLQCVELGIHVNKTALTRFAQKLSVIDRAERQKNRKQLSDYDIDPPSTVDFGVPQAIQPTSVPVQQPAYTPAPQQPVPQQPVPQQPVQPQAPPQQVAAPAPAPQVQPAPQTQPAQPPAQPVQQPAPQRSQPEQGESSMHKVLQNMSYGEAKRRETEITFELGALKIRENELLAELNALSQVINEKH